MPIAFRGLFTTAILMSAMHVGCPPAIADALADAGTARDAIALLGGFPVEVARITTAIERTPLPSGHVSFECTYPALGRAQFFVKDHVLRYSSSTAFPELNLQSKVQPVQVSSKQFAGKFTPILRQWSQATLPQASAAFSRAADEVRIVQDEIKGGARPNELQRTRVISALDNILASLDTGKTELTTMTRILSEYLQQQRASRESLSHWSMTANTEVKSFAQKTRTEINAQRCKGDGLDKLGTMERNANASITIITSSIYDLQERTDAADKALSIVLGTFVGYASRYEAVTDRLKVVKEAPVGSIIQNLHLTIATKTWQDFVGTAK